MTTLPDGPDHRGGTDVERGQMRRGDQRPFDDRRVPLTFLPPPGEPFRWLPKHGGPYCVAEFITQSIVKAFAHLPVYTAIIVTLIILIQVYGVPWGLGK